MSNIEYKNYYISPFEDYFEYNWEPGTLTGKWYLDKCQNIVVEIAVQKRRFFKNYTAYLWMKETEIRIPFIPIINDCKS